MAEVALLSAAMKRVRAGCLVALAIAATASIFVPFETAIANWSELNVGLGPLVGLLAPTAALLTAGLVLVSIVGVGLLGDRGLALLCAALVCLWAQAALFQADYGTFDGEPIDWSIHAGRGLLELSFWLAAITLALVSPRVLASRAGWIVSIVMIAQSVSLAAALSGGEPLDRFRADSATDEARSAPEDADSFTLLSTERNVIVLVIDSLQSDFFAELLGSPDFAASLPPGFTYYRNAVSAYRNTRHSLASILTSRTPDHQASADWGRSQMRRSVPARLAKQGWRAAASSFAPRNLSCRGSAMTTALGFECRSAIALAAMLEGMSEGSAVRNEAIGAARSVYRVSVFRLAPHYAKRLVYVGGAWKVADPLPDEQALAELDPRIEEKSRRDIAILEALVRESRTGSTGPTFKFVHLYGIHVPSTLDAGCGWIGHDEPDISGRSVAGETLRSPRTHALPASRCLMSKVIDYLRKLESLGVYDQSLIFVVGDHGRRATPIDEALAEPPLPESPGVGDGRAGAARLINISRGVPVFLVKHIGDRSPMRVSDAPVSLCDIPRTIFSELQLQADFGCESIFDISDRRDTPRVHYRRFIPGRPMPKRGDRYHEFRLEGHSWRTESWVEVPREPAQ